MTAALQRKLAPSNTANRMLDAAERLVQTMGFNWFSYADIAEELGVRKASLHHHFPTKGALGRALIERYLAQFKATLLAIDSRNVDASVKLAAYVKLYADVLRANRLCLCGMLAAEFSSLPEEMQSGIRQFFDFNEKWLTNVVAQGRRRGIFHSRGSALDVARVLLSSFEGALLVARPYNDARRFRAATRQILENLRAAPVARRS
ncbi:MAG: TetR/AcrR family transcriptional regulator [Planctomycetota bacterium]